MTGTFQFWSPPQPHLFLLKNVFAFSQLISPSYRHSQNCLSLGRLSPVIILLCYKFCLIYNLNEISNLNSNRVLYQNISSFFFFGRFQFFFLPLEIQLLSLVHTLLLRSMERVIQKGHFYRVFQSEIIENSENVFVCDCF